MGNKYDVTCSECGGDHFHRKGKVATRNQGTCWRYKCQDCGQNEFLPIEETQTVKKTAAVQPPTIPSTEKPVLEIIADNCNRVERKIEAEKARKWMPFNVNTSEPCMLVFVGDPHVDDDKCDWPVLREHLQLMNDPRVFGINIGDLTNNWVGRLAMTEYANQHTTKSEAYRLANYVLNESGVNWLVNILGNHDTWNDGAEILKLMLSKTIIADDWRARFRLVFPNGFEVKVDAAHDHKGHSQYNPLHAQKKVTLFEEHADIVIAGHKHTWALAQEENPHTNRITWYARARGYKLSYSAYDKRGGWGNQNKGHSIAAVIEPTTGRITCFSDVATGIDFLNTVTEMEQAA